MQRLDGRLILSASDLSAFLGCRHRTGLDLAVVEGRLVKPRRTDPFVVALQQKGQAHEQRYVDWLRAQGLRVRDLGDVEDREARFARTEEALAEGADVIVQAALRHDGWLGYADILRRVERPGAPSRFGAWAYEAWDTKLARETRGGTILQLALYSDLLGALQGVTPEHFHVVSPQDAPPQHVVHTYRVDEYAAYYRRVRAEMLETVTHPADAVQAAYYPEPVETCDVCHWWDRCNARRRADDHLSFIANIGRTHRVELVAQDVPTLTAAAALPVPVPFAPARGSAETYGRLAHQARVQHQQRTSGSPVIERLPVQGDEDALRDGPAGLRRLPAPSPGDLFLDLEGARFAREGGREYLFGVWGMPVDAATGAATGEATYRAWWAFDDASEKAAFEAVMDVVAETLAVHPEAHVYHFNHYEPTAFKRLMGRHATRAEAMDVHLRSGRFVDLYPVVRQGLRAGVESYSIKQLEQYYGFVRDVDLRTVSAHLQALELALESQAPGTITPEMRAAVEGYNRDDCHSTSRLRDWLEAERAAIEAEGTPVPRPVPNGGEASEKISVLQEEVEALRARLLEGLPPEASDPTHAGHPRWLLAYLIDWHRREDRAQWADFFRLVDLPEDELLDESRAVAGLAFVERIEVVRNVRTGHPTGSVIDRYHYPPQDVDLGRKGKLKAPDGSSFGELVAHDREMRTLDVKKGRKLVDVHPSAVFAADVVTGTIVQQSVLRLARRVLEGDESGCGLDLLHRRPPRVRSGAFSPEGGEDPTAYAVRVVADLDRTTLAIQGPPGAGKTYVGAQMVRALVAAGQRVGVAAVSHKVILNLMEEVASQAAKAGETVRLGRKVNVVEDDGSGIRQMDDNDNALAALVAGEIDVLGGTAWLWARENAVDQLDVLFVDEAGQMSLANTLGVAQAAGSLVLLGDPQQLEQPQKGSHPDGVDVSALQHVIGEAKTMPPERGLFMPETWRLAPAVCAFTSELFYEGALHPRPELARQRLVGAGRFDGAGLHWVPVDHDGNRNASTEEVDEVERIINALLGARPARWVTADGVERDLTPGDLRIVAPFNAQVNRISERLGDRGVPVGTVDRFQGQTAAVVIYSMATSRPEDAPRGLEFLYSLNRLNVATSRARCAAIIVASPRLLFPECRTPRQMQLANALCRFKEMA
ncbi:MAG: TM0106 family RecB-like putative nuclease [Vicinamibacterales bacterium]|nr:TM0106 family RecB-like putative nuclease [Vicinamibacterales bacterium]